MPLDFPHPILKSPTITPHCFFGPLEGFAHVLQVQRWRRQSDLLPGPAVPKGLCLGTIKWKRISKGHLVQPSESPVALSTTLSPRKTTVSSSIGGPMATAMGSARKGTLHVLRGNPPKQKQQCLSPIPLAQAQRCLPLHVQSRIFSTTWQHKKERGRVAAHVLEKERFTPASPHLGAGAVRPPPFPKGCT